VDLAALVQKNNPADISGTRVTCRERAESAAAEQRRSGVATMKMCSECGCHGCGDHERSPNSPPMTKHRQNAIALQHSRGLPGSARPHRAQPLNTLTAEGRATSSSKNETGRAQRGFMPDWNIWWPHTRIQAGDHEMAKATIGLSRQRLREKCEMSQRGRTPYQAGFIVDGRDAREPKRCCQSRVCAPTFAGGCPRDQFAGVKKFVPAGGRRVQLPGPTVARAGETPGAGP